MKFAIFSEPRFENNGFADTNIDPNLSAFAFFREKNGKDHTISYDLLQHRVDAQDFVILCFLTLSPGTLFSYMRMMYHSHNARKYLFLFEPKVVAPIGYLKILHAFFDRIYTWDDSLVDNKKYYKFIWPQSKNANLPPIDYKIKKDIVLMNANKFSLGRNELYSLREKVIRFFEGKNINFDLYGPRWGTPNLKQKIFGYKTFPSWRGRAENKIKTLSQYKFNICFENMSDSLGYITEKIWDSFKAKTVPIYFGASNITDYVPKECFIDYRDFSDLESLYYFLCHMEESTYNSYIYNIENFLATKDAKRWFDEDWAEDFIVSLQS